MHRDEGNAKPVGTHSANFCLSQSWVG